MRYAVLTFSAILASLLGFALAGCGSGAQSAGEVPTPGQSTGALVPTDTGSVGTDTTGGSGTDTGAGGTGVVHYEVWFHRGEQLFVVTRTARATPRVGAAAIEQLLAGPTAERARSTASGRRFPTARSSSA